MLNSKPYATSWLDHFDIALILNGKADYKIKEFQQKQKNLFSIYECVIERNLTKIIRKQLIKRQAKEFRRDAKNNI